MFVGPLCTSMNISTAQPQQSIHHVDDIGTYGALAPGLLLFTILPECAFGIGNDLLNEVR